MSKKIPILFILKTVKINLYFISVPLNDELTKLNNALYLYMGGMRKVFETDPNILQLAFNKAKQPYKSGLFLNKFICGSGACKILFNSEVCNLDNSRVPTEDHCQKLVEDMVYKGIGYEPSLFLYNAERATLDGDYFLAMQVEVDDPDHTNKEYIPAWHFKKNGTVQVEIIDPHFAYYSQDPVFVVGFEPNGRYNMPQGGTLLPPTGDINDPEAYNPAATSPYFPPPGGTNYPTSTSSSAASSSSSSHSGSSSSPPTPNTIQHHYIHLFAHHEQYTDSEYFITFVHIGHGGNVNERNISKVPRNYVDCGCRFDIDGTFLSVSNGDIFSFATYEHDDLTSFKHITIGLNNTRLDYKASCATDLYVYEADQNVGSTPFFSVGSSHQYTNGPALHEMQRF